MDKWKNVKDVGKIAGGVWLGNKLSQPKEPIPYERTDEGMVEDLYNTDAMIFRILGGVVGVIIALIFGPSGFGILGISLIGFVGFLLGPRLAIIAPLGVLIGMFWLFWIIMNWILTAVDALKDKFLYG